jgi:glutamine amidotransferase
VIVVVDFGAGNVGSVANMLRKIGAPVVVSDDPDVIGDAERLVVPGVGAFDVAMASIEERGLVSVLDDRASSGVPILGICLGMQLFARSSEEGERPGLGWIAGDVGRLRPAIVGDRLVVPHMGWDRIRVTRAPKSIEPGPVSEGRFYFVHSYGLVCDDPDDALGITDYGRGFCSVVERDNLLGVQFHPEKSHRYGKAFLTSWAGI